MCSRSRPWHHRVLAETNVTEKDKPMSWFESPRWHSHLSIGVGLRWRLLAGLVAVLLWQSCPHAADSIDPEIVTELNEQEAVECLKNTGPLLFKKLTKLSPKVAAVLAKHKDGIELNALEQMDEATAVALARVTGDLNLDGLLAVDEPSALAISRSQANLSMRGLSELKSKPLAEKLAKQGRICLPGISVIDATLAAVIRECQCTLEADSLTVLDHEYVARALVGDGQRDVELDSLRKLTADGARGLVETRCDLRFPRLVEVDDEAAKVLARHVGVLDLDSACRMSPRAIAAILANVGPIGLGSLPSLGDPAPPGVLKALAQHRWPLCLNGLSELSLVEAAAVRDRTSATDLAGIKTLTVPIAEALLHCKGYIWLTGVETLEPGVAETLLRHQATPHVSFILSVDLRETIPERFVEAFERHEGISFGNPYCP